MDAAIPMSDQLYMVERLKEAQPGGAGCDRATWVQERAGGPHIRYFLERIPLELL